MSQLKNDNIFSKISRSRLDTGNKMTENNVTLSVISHFRDTIYTKSKTTL